MKDWTLTTLLVKTGAKVVRHARYVTFQLAEMAVAPNIFAAMLLYLNIRRNRLRVPLSLDLSSERDRITSRQAKREKVSLGCRGWGGRRYTGARVARRRSRTSIIWEI